MAIKLASVKVDLAQEAAGTWVDYPDFPGVSFLVSSTDLPAYKTARSAVLTRYARKHGGALLLDDTAPELTPLYAKHLLHGWRGFDVEYSPAVAAETLSDPAFRAVAAAVLWCAGSVADVNAEFTADMGKNSRPLSAGG